MTEVMGFRPSNVRRQFEGSVLGDEMLEAASYVFLSNLIDNGDDSWDTEVNWGDLISYVQFSIEPSNYHRLIRSEGNIMETLRRLFTELVRRGYITRRDADGSTYLTATQQYVEFFRHYAV